MPANLNKNLTPRQLQLLKLIADFQTNQCYSPTIAELASEMNISRSTVFEHIAELRRKKLLIASPGKARSSGLTTKAQNLLSKLNLTQTNCNINPPDGIPLAGKVAAGTPIEAIENTEHISLNSMFANREDTFMLEVKGNSMAGDSINPGDYIICRQTACADNGQLVVAAVDEENVTLKRFYKEKTAVRLQPSNKQYQPIYSKNCKIKAVVIGLVRKF